MAARIWINTDFGGGGALHFLREANVAVHRHMGLEPIINGCRQESLGDLALAQGYRE